jgi:Arc/MetJ family transcription regulator
MHDYYPICILDGGNMRTTLDLPDALVDDALRVSHQRTKTAVIITALRELVRKSRLQELKRFKGRVDLDLDLSALRKRA